MTARTHNPEASGATQPANAAGTPRQGLSPDELRAEQAGDLPDREAMSVMSLGGVGIDVPPADHLDDFLNGTLPNDTLPTDTPPTDTPPLDGPGSSWPIDLNPTDGTPVAQPPVEVAPGDPVAAPIDDDTLISVPGLPHLTDDTTAEA